MKHGKMITLLILVLVLGSLAGCSGENQKDKDSEKVKKSEEAKEVKEADVAIDFLVDNDTGRLDGWNEFTDPQYEGSEYLMAVLITSDAPIKNVKFMDVEMGDATGEIPEFKVNAIVHEEEVIESGTPFVYWTEFPNFMPNLVISYMDPTGEEKVLSIAMSGEDSSMIVDPAKIENEANLAINYLDENEFDLYNAFEEYTDQIYGDSEDAVSTLITTDSEVQDFKIMDAEVKSTEEDSTGFAVNAIIYECDNITPDKPMAYKTQFPGSSPDRIISYVDMDGKEKVYSLSMSGEDGSLLLLPAFIDE